MKISIDDKELLTITDTQKRVIAKYMSLEVFERNLQKRIKSILISKYNRCLDRLEDEGIPKLVANGITSVPINKDQLAQLILDQPEDDKTAASE